MKLRKAEIASIIITIFFVVTAVFVLIAENRSTASVDVSFARNEKTSSSALHIQPSEVTSSSEKGSIFKKHININAATEEELVELPGIGEVLAKRIVDYRKENGLYKSIDEIMNVSGIGYAKFNEIKDYISVQTEY